MTMSSARVGNLLLYSGSRFPVSQTSGYQPGEGISSPQRLREFQSWSIACRRSVTEILSLCDDSIMSSRYHLKPRAARRLDVPAQDVRAFSYAFPACSALKVRFE